MDSNRLPPHHPSAPLSDAAVGPHHSEPISPGDSLSQPAFVGLTGRALILSALSVIGYTVANQVSVLHRYEIPGTGYLPRGVVFYFLLLTFYNQIAQRIVPKARLRREELMVVFCALLAMDIIPAQDFAQHFYLNLPAMAQYAGPDTPAGDLRIMDHFPPGLLPSRDPDSPVIKWFYSGLPEGESVPYRAWIVPYLIWTPYIFLFYWLLLWSAALMSYRWEHHERLLYPLMQVPLETVESREGKWPAMLKSKLMWGCFLLITLLYTLIFLSAYFPDLPEIKIARTTGEIARAGPLSAFNHILLEFRPEMIGIAYLLAAEVGFSLVFFFLLRHVVVMSMIGYGAPPPHYVFLQFQVAGGYLILAVALLWKARGYLRDCWRLAVWGGEGAGFYRLCFLGIVTGFGGVVAWSAAVGISIQWAAIQFATFVIGSLVASRVICETGMFLYASPLFGLGTVLFSGFSSRMSSQDITLMTATSWVGIRNSSAMAMPYMMQTFKLGSSIGLRRAHIAWLIFGAIVLAVLTCHVTVPYLVYRTGIDKLSHWPQRSGLGAVQRLSAFLNHPSSLDTDEWAGLATGGGIVTFLVVMRQHFPWWPLHPLGFVTSLWGWPIDRYWFSIFIGWAIKMVVVRFGGYKVYRMLRPAAFGLILGLSFVMTLWMILHYKWDAPAVIFD